MTLVMIFWSFCSSLSWLTNNSLQHIIYNVKYLNILKIQSLRLQERQSTFTQFIIERYSDFSNFLRRQYNPRKIELYGSLRELQERAKPNSHFYSDL